MLGWSTAMTSLSSRGVCLRCGCDTGADAEIGSVFAVIGIPVTSVSLVLEVRKLFNIPHVRRRLDARNVFENDVADTDKRDGAAGNPFVPVAVHNDAANEDIDCVHHQRPLCLSVPLPGSSSIELTDTPADEREHERRIARHLRRNLELWGRMVRNLTARTSRCGGDKPRKPVAVYTCVSHVVFRYKWIAGDGSTYKDQRLSRRRRRSSSFWMTRSVNTSVLSRMRMANGMHVELTR
nr:hypothetical protein CFP56_11987 [Quercus suber]